MDVSEKLLSGVVILSLKGRLDSNTSEAFERKLLEAVRTAEGRLILDFAELDYISSAGLRVLLKAAKEIKRIDGEIKICAVKDYIREVFEMSGFISFLHIYPSLEDSIAAF